jgi:hypothetical protein
LQSSAGSFQTVARKWKIFAQTSFPDEKTFFQQFEDMGYFKKTQKRAAPTTNPMTDPNARIDMLKGNVTIKCLIYL